jgi:hypothetical protein
MDKENGTQMVVFAVKCNDGKFGKNYILLASGNSNDLSKGDFFSIWAIKSLYEYIDKNLDNWNKIEENLYGSLCEKGIMVVKKTGVYNNKQRNKCACVEVLEKREVFAEEENSTRKEEAKYCGEARRKLVICPLILKDCEAIDTIVKEGDTIELRNYYEKTLRCYYKIAINGSEDLKAVIGNPWLNDVFKEATKEERIIPVLELLVGPKRRHPVSGRSVLTFTHRQTEEDKNKDLNNR